MAITTRDLTIETRDGIIETRGLTIETRDGVIETRDLTIETRDGVIETRDVATRTLDIANKVLDRLGDPEIRILGKTDADIKAL